MMTLSVDSTSACFWIVGMPFAAAGAFSFARALTGGEGRRPLGTALSALWRRYRGPALVFAVGLVLSAWAAAFAHRNEWRAYREEFAQLANGRFLRLVGLLESAGSTELEGLARFCEAHDPLTLDRFRQYAGYLAQNKAVQAWEWIPAVPAAEKEPFERWARGAGVAGFQIWEPDSQGHRVPAKRRELYYPVLWVVPPENNQQALGFDLGSEPRRRAALEEAARTGRVTATNPITLVQETGTQKGMLLYRPVFDLEHPDRLRGFALAVLRMGDLLENARQDDLADLSLTLLHDSGAAELLASSGSTDHERSQRFSVRSEFRAVDRDFSVTISPTPEFLRLHPARAHIITGLTGLLLTAAATVAVGATFRSRQHLEQLVAHRTAELRESEQQHRLLTQHSVSAVAVHQIVLNASGEPVDYVFLDANPAFETHTGLAVADILGRRATEVLPGIEHSPFIATYGNVVRTGEPVVFEQFSEPLGRHYLVHAYRLGEGRFATVFLDITDRMRSEQSLARVAEEHRILLHNIQTQVWYLTGEHSYGAVNEAHAAFLGLDRKAIAFRDMYDVFPKHVVEVCREGNREVFATGKPLQTQEWVPNAVGQPRLLSILKSPKLRTDGTVEYVVCSAEDVTERKKVEDSLRESEARLRLITANTPSVIYTYTIQDGTPSITYINDNVREVLGFEPETFIDDVAFWFACLHPDDTASLADKLQGKECLTEYRFKDRDGRYHWLADQQKVLKAAGTTLHMVGAWWDITERKRAEQVLRESEHNFRDCFESIGDMILVASPEGRILYGNQAMRSRLGYDLKALCECHVLDLHPPDVYDEAHAILAAMARGERSTCPLPLRARDGELVPVETRVWSGTWGGNTCMFAVSKDLSEQQAALQMFERMFEMNPAPMALTRLPEQTFEKVNRAFHAITGCAAGEVLGNTLEALGLTVKSGEAAAINRHIGAGESIRSLPLTLRSKRGQLRSGLLFGEPVQSQGRRYFLTTLVDVTEQKQVERDLRQIQQTLEERVALRTAELEKLNAALREENVRRHRVEASLEDNRHNLRRLASQLTLAEEDQRHDLAVQLHDTIGQELAMARLRLEHARSKPDDDSGQHLDVAADLLDAAITQVRGLTHDLGANVLYQLGLPAALRSMGHRVAEQHGLTFAFHEGGQYERGHKDIEVQAFRTARELVYNVVKHAQASRVIVSLVITSEDIAVCVEDDGVGFAVDAGLEKTGNTGDGFGLFSIRERLAILNGRLDIQSAPGRGTVATAIVPRLSQPAIDAAQGEP